VIRLLLGLKSSTAFVLLRLLSRRDRKILILITGTTLLLAMLDLFGVLLIGVVGSLSLTGISNGSIGDRVSEVLIFLNLDNLDLERQVVILGLLAATLLLAKTILSLIIVRKTIYFMSRRAALISSELVLKYFSISVVKLNVRSAQKSIFALTDGVTRIMLSVIAASISLIADVSLLLVLGVGLFFVDPLTALGSFLVFSSAGIFLYMRIHKEVRRLGEQQGSLKIASAQKIYEALNNYRELMVRDRRGFYASQISEIRFRLAQSQSMLTFMNQFNKYSLEIVLVVSSILLALYQFSNSSAVRAIATITIFVAASTRILPAILRFQQGVVNIRAAIAESKPTIQLIQDIKNVIPITYIATPISRIHEGFSAKVKITKLEFSYEKAKKVIDQVDLNIDPGEFIGIVGSSGAGKTTLLDLALGALEPDNGEVKISGVEPLLAFKKWPGAVSYVSQSSQLIEGTIYENLGLGYLLSEIEEYYCWESLELANLSEFVNSLPEKLHTFIGDRGTKLSGGQRQRLIIARALVTKPRLLILDEATSALDGATEAEISSSLQSLKGEMSLMVVAHRLSTVVNADRIYFLADGAVKGSGTFSELRNENPEFRSQAELMGL
jgi:ABC-type multidrug transport system fused ATPase/permease subunit